MGRTRRLWNRLSGRHDEKAQAAGDASGDLRGGTAQSPIGRVATAQPDVGIEPDERFTAKEIWLDAYKKLEEDEGTKKIVLAYETLLSNQLNGTENGLSGCRTPEEKISGMQRVIEVTLKKASRHSERKQGFVKAAKVINTISSAVIKPMLQTEAVASLAWAGVCVALEFSIRAATADIDMVDGLCHVAKRMEWYMLLHTLLLEKTQPSTSVHESQHAKLRGLLRSNIQELYYSLLMYEMQCVCYCYRDSRITRTLRALVTLDDWKAKLTEIKELESRVQMDMSQFGQSQTKDRLVEIAAGADEKFESIQHLLNQFLTSHEQTLNAEEKIRLQQLVGLFSTSDYHKQMRFNPIRVPGTCEWFCNHHTFKEWLGSDGGLLLVSAAPGCGKSTLARHLIEEVLPREDSDCKILHFFFKDTIEQNSLNTAICAVLHQLLLDNYALVGELQEAIIQAGGRKVAKNSSSLCNIFSAACRGFLGRIICVFDALDECKPDDSSELIRQIKGMLQSNIKIKFLVTTRGYPQLVNQFNEFQSGLIHLDGDGKQEKDAIQQEIGLVLDYKLEHLSKTKNLDHQPERKIAIEKALRSKGSEQRTYLWLKLVFDIMERIPWKSDNDWAKLLISPPQNVNDAYASFLQKVPEDERSAVKVLLHLMVAAFRPLTLREMSIALIVHESAGGNDEGSLGLQPEGEFKNWVLQTCGFFVTIYDNKLDFIHQTAKEFLFGSGPRMLWQQGPDRFSPVTDQAAHKTMAESSITYLSFRCFNSRQFHERARAYAPLAPLHQSWSQYAKTLREKYGFLEYTLKYWHRHFTLCQHLDGMSFQDVGDEYIPLYVSLFTPDGHCAPGWMFLHFKYVQRPPSDIHGPIDLVENYKVVDSALWFDHVRILVHELGRNTSTTAFLFHAAAAQNAENCLQYLVATGQDVNAQDESGATALCFAARNKSTEAVIRLLDYNADVNMSEGPQKRPLSYFDLPYDLQQWKLVRRLVCQGADLNETSMTAVKMETKMTPLAWAAQIPNPTTLAHDDSIQRLDGWIREKCFASGLEKMTDLLQDLDIFSEEKFLEAYNTSLVKLFLDHGANIDGVDSSWSSGGHDHQHPMTALESACHHLWNRPGNHVFWNAVFLLHGGANSRINIETGNSALDWLFRSLPEGKPAYQFHGTGLIDLLQDGLESWNTLAMLLLKHNPASDYINSPISTTTMQTRLHSLSALPDVKGRQEKFRLLLRHGAGVNCQDVYGKTPLHYLSSHPVEIEECAVIETLIVKGADLEIQDSFGRTPIYYVRSPVVLDTLAKNGAEIGARDHQGNTPLQVILAGCGADFGPEMIQSLIKLGADTAVRNYAGETLLHTAATSGFADGLLILLQDGIDLDVINDRGETPLQAALNCRCHAAAALLLERGADAKPLLQRNFDTEQRDWRTGATLLVFVSESHTHGAVRTLLRRGANPNALPAVDDSDVGRYLGNLDYIQDREEWFITEMMRSRTRRIVLRESSRPWHHTDADHRDGRPLHLAMRNGWTRDAEITVDLLLRHGAKIEARSGLGQTPLQVACHHGNEEGVRALLQRGANARVRASQWNHTPLGILCQAWQPNVGLIRDLVTHGAMSDSGCPDGPDLWRISRWWSNRVRGPEISCRREADSGAVTHDVTSPEYQSRCECRQCCRDHENRACAAVQTLLDAGAWIRLRNPVGKVETWATDIDTPRYWGWEDLATLLEQGAVPRWRRAWIPPDTRRRSWPWR